MLNPRCGEVSFLNEALHIAKLPICQSDLVISQSGNIEKKLNHKKKIQVLLLFITHL